VSSCLTRKADGEPCRAPDELLACRQEGEIYQQHCEVEQAEQCAEGTTCRILTGTEDERYCSAGVADSPCAEDADCEGGQGLLCAPGADEEAVRRCREPHFLEPGAACERTEECAQGTVCWSPTSLCREPPTCEAPGTLKQRCCEPGQCEPELTCLTFEQEPFCWRPHEGEGGDPCALDRHCVEGLACVQGQGRHATCAPPGAQGAYCQEDRHCQEGLRCAELDPGRCSSGEVGSPCGSNSDCLAEWVCDQHDWVCFER